jgi:hypothetical protein
MTHYYLVYYLGDGGKGREKHVLYDVTQFIDITHDKPRRCI